MFVDCGDGLLNKQCTVFWAWICRFRRYHKLCEVCKHAAGVFWGKKRCSWDFLTCYKLGEVCKPAAGAFFFGQKGVPGISGRVISCVWTHFQLFGHLGAWEDCFSQSGSQIAFPKRDNRTIRLLFPIGPIGPIGPT